MAQEIEVAKWALAGSFLTVLVTGIVSIWSKWLESRQKIKEHQLSIRSAYVTRKIDAAQVYVNNVNLLYASLYTENYQYNLIANTLGGISEDAVNTYSKNHQDNLSIMRNSNDFSMLYFNQPDIRQKLMYLGNLKNTQNAKLLDIQFYMENREFKQDELEQTINMFSDELNTMISINNSIMDLITESIDLINKEVAKYDITVNK